MNERSTIPSIQYTRTRRVSISPEQMRERRLIMGLKNDPRANVFRMLRTNLLRQLRDKQWSSIAIVSPSAGNGKTFIACNLAIALGLEVNQTLLLVDADLGKPKVDWTFGFQAELGLADYLKGEVSLEDILVHPGFERLVLLPGHGEIKNSSEWLASPKMANLVREVKARYQSRIILFDLPPLLESDDALLFMPNYDAVLLVVENGGNTPEEIKRALAVLEGTNLVGVVLNKSAQANKGHNVYDDAEK